MSRWGFGTLWPGARAALPGPRVLLRTELDFTRERGRPSWSVDGRWQTLSDEFVLIYDWRTGTFQGPQYARFCFNPAATGGRMDVDWFRFGGDKSGRIQQFRSASFL